MSHHVTSRSDVAEDATWNVTTHSSQTIFDSIPETSSPLPDDKQDGGQRRDLALCVACHVYVFSVLSVI